MPEAGSIRRRGRSVLGVLWRAEASARSGRGSHAYRAGPIGLGGRASSAGRDLSMLGGAFAPEAGPERACTALVVADRRAG